MLRRLVLVVLALATSLGLAAPTAVPAQAADRVTAKSLLKKLTVAAETTSPRYDRDLFDHWVMRRGACNVRETVLIAESRIPARRNARCTVTKGRWRNEYTGRTLTSWLNRCGAARTKVAKPAKGKPEGARATRTR